MNLNKYQELAGLTAKGSINETNKRRCFTMGMAVEMGHIMTIVKDDSYHSGANGGVSPDKVRVHLGDMLWYLSQVATSYKLSLDSIALENLDKLKSRFDEHYTEVKRDKRRDDMQEEAGMLEDIREFCIGCADGRDEARTCHERACTLWHHRKVAFKSRAINQKLLS